MAAASYSAVLTSPLVLPDRAKWSVFSSLCVTEPVTLKPSGPPRSPGYSELSVHGPARIGAHSLWAHSPHIPQGPLPRGMRAAWPWAERSEARRRRRGEDHRLRAGGRRRCGERASAKMIALLSGAARRLQHVLGRANCRERTLSAASFLTR